jgi:intracellular protein transport protein USO1
MLGICYEFNREPGEVTRSTVSPILSRLGVDTLVGRMTRLREDERFKAISPESIILPYPTPAELNLGLRAEGDEVEVWFDWAFVDFWKSNYCGWPFGTYTVDAHSLTIHHKIRYKGG